MKQIKILVAEDDTHIRTGLADTLESEGYTVTQTENGKQALECFKQEKFNLVLLDVMMPEKSGYDVCQAIRTENKNVPIIMLTAKAEEIDKVVGLKLGADDYITKPFGIHELLARVEAVLRRAGTGSGKPGTPVKEPFEFSRFTVNPKTFKLSGKGRSCDISRRELDLIRIFSDHPGEVLDRNTLLDRIWGIEYGGTTRTLDQHIAILRKKIESDPARPELITTVHGIGYRFSG